MKGYLVGNALLHLAGRLAPEALDLLVHHDCEQLLKAISQSCGCLLLSHIACVHQQDLA